MSAVEDRFVALFQAGETVKRLDAIEDRLRGGPSGPTSGGVSDEWKASVDRQLGQLHGDVRALLYGLIGGFLFLLTAGAVAYSNLSGQFTDTRKDIANLQVSQQRLNDGYDSINRKIDLLLDQKSSGGKRP